MHPLRTSQGGPAPLLLPLGSLLLPSSLTPLSLPFTPLASPLALQPSHQGAEPHDGGKNNSDGMWGAGREGGGGRLRPPPLRKGTLGVEAREVPPPEPWRWVLSPASSFSPIGTRRPLVTLLLSQVTSVRRTARRTASSEPNQAELSEQSRLPPRSPSVPSVMPPCPNSLGAAPSSPVCGAFSELPPHV